MSKATDVPFDNGGGFGGVGSTLALNGYSTVIGRIISLSKNSGRIVNNDAANAVLTVNALMGNSSFSGIMMDDSGAGTLGLRKSGSVTLTLTGNNSYSGETWIDGGVLSVSADDNLGAAAGALTLNSGTLTTTGI